MGDIKLGEPFGMDISDISDAEWALAVERITHDLRSDFIYAPHLAVIYKRAAIELIDAVKKELKDGQYKPNYPITIEVPKSFRMRVLVTPPRPGPAYSRPGSILLPKDRLLYQILADRAASIIKNKVDPTRSFSHSLDKDDSQNMFLPTRVCWGALQASLKEHTKEKMNKYVLKLDIANYFGSINHHTLINVLDGAEYPKKYLSRLETILTSYTGQRSSRGIIQGIFPSDLLGNFYMEPIDRFLADQGVSSARYVDDLYIFLASVDAADNLMRNLISELRTYDLVLNEAKCVIMPVSALNTEEPDLEELFQNAIEEISSQLEEEDLDTDYGFQSIWDEGETEDAPEKEEKAVNLELEATKFLFDSIPEYPGHEETIERFCLPLFTKASSDYAIRHVFDEFRRRPSMTQIYVSYLSKFLEDSNVYKFLYMTLEEKSLNDWQRMWILAALMSKAPSNEEPVKIALKVLKDGATHEATRAVAGIYVGTYGDNARRLSLFGSYASLPPYVQSAVYFSSRAWSGAQKNNARAHWGNQNPLNELITKAIYPKAEKKK